jgi:hypothetical protein
MVTTSKKQEEQIFIQIDNERIELTGADKEAFLADRAQMQQEALLLETEYKAKQDARASALTKLGEIAGLTKEELDAIL